MSTNSANRPDPEATEVFVRQLTEHQTRLYGYVFSLVGDHSRASDVLQETNLVLWRKLPEFDASKPFLPWAFSVARFQVMAHLRDRSRDRLLLDEGLADKICAEAETQSEDLDGTRYALRGCLQALSPANRKLIESRYSLQATMTQLAEQTNRSVGAIKVALLRIRRQLAECVQRKLAEESQ